MADTQTRQQEGQVEGSVPQISIDKIFAEQIGGGFDPASQAGQAWQAYFTLAEQTLATARRVSEMSALSLLRQQIVAQVTAEVLHQVQTNPQFLAPLVPHLKQQMQRSS